MAWLSMSLDEKYCIFSNRPIHADYENDLNSIPQKCSYEGAYKSSDEYS